MGSRALDDTDRGFDGDPSWCATRALPDGTRVHLRPILPSDKDALRRAFRAQSPRSRYMRFLGALDDLSEPMLRYLTEVDQRDHIAIVAILDSPDMKTERGVGVARLVRLKDDPEVADAAVSVADDVQRRGIGSLLLHELVRAALAHDIRRIRADVLDDNTTMCRILAEAGATKVSRSPDQDFATSTYELALDEPRGRDHAPSRLLAVLRGAAETMAVRVSRALSEDARALLASAGVRLEGSATTGPTTEAGEGERDTEGDGGAGAGTTGRA